MRRETVPDRRHLVVVIGVLAALLTAGGGCGRRTPQQPPNILLLAFDTLRADHLGLYGYGRPTSPTLDAFAATAAVFEHAYSPSSWTRASFASYFTGLRPRAHGCEDRAGFLADSLVTLAECLRAQGYRTGAVIANMNIAPELGFDQGFAHYEHPPVNAGYRDGPRYTDAAAIVDAALRWLTDGDPGRPWFLFVLLFDPHDPYLHHPDTPFGDPVDRHRWGARGVLTKLDSDMLPPEITAHGKRAVVDLYDGEIRYADHHAGRLLAALDSLGVADRTVVVVTADHGEGLWEHENVRSHGHQVYDNQIHVPLLIRWPGVTRPGTRIPDAVGTLDLYATLVEGAGAALPPQVQSRSLLPLLRGRDRRSPIVCQERLEGADLLAVVAWPWKLILDRTRGWRLLFRLDTDPDELRELAAARPGLADSLAVTLRDVTRADSLLAAQLVGGAEVRRPSPETIRALRALGYVR